MERCVFGDVAVDARIDAGEHVLLGFRHAKRHHHAVGCGFVDGADRRVATGHGHVQQDDVRSYFVGPRYQVADTVDRVLYIQFLHATQGVEQTFPVKADITADEDANHHEPFAVARLLRADQRKG